MKIAISTDSGSGITQAESRKLGIYVVPMPFQINGKEYYEDISLSREDFFDMLRGECTISTSQPSLNSLIQTWDELLKDNDAVIHVPLTSGLSNATQTAIMLSQDGKYKDRVFVPDSRGVSITQRQHCIFAKNMAELGFSPAEIRDNLTKESENNSIYIGVDTLKYLKNGGRITPLAAAVGTLLHIKPVLTIVEGGRLDAYSRVRTAHQMKDSIIEGIRTDLKGKLGDPEMNSYYMGIAYTDNREQAEQFAEEISDIFPGRLNKEIVISPLSLLISCHIGQNGLGLAVVEEAKALRKGKTAAKDLLRRM